MSNEIANKRGLSELEQAQAECAALRAEAQRLCHQVHSRAGDVCSLNCPQQSCFSTTAGQALLDELARLRAVAEAAKTILVTAMQACKGGYRGEPCPHSNLPTFPTHAWWCDRCFFALRDNLKAAGYLKEGGE